MGQRGARIHTAAGKVDFLYRNLDQVERTIREAAHDIIRYDYNQQPTYGFYSVIYLAETQICVPLYDPEAHLSRLKRQVASNLTQALFAVNETYFLSDKKAMDKLALFPLLPAGYVKKLSGILARPGETAEELSERVIELGELWRKVVSLAGAMYQPRFNL